MSIDDILREYSLKQNRAIDNQNQRKEELYKIIPRLKEIEKEQNLFGIKMAKVVLIGNKEELNKLKNEYEKLSEEKSILLKQNGYSENYLDIVYECNKCNDTGYLDDGNRCVCLKNKIVESKYNQSNLKDVLSRENFNTFNPDVFSDEKIEGEKFTQRENMALNKASAESFCYNFKKDNNHNLLLYGPTGNGKTFLINCIAKNILDKGYTVIYQTSFQLFDTIRKYRFANNTSELNESDYNTIFEADLLVIDDLGTELTNTFTISEFFNIVNTRILNRKKTIISTNLTPGELSRIYTDRVFSRIANYYESLPFYGKDIRMSHEYANE